MNKIAIYIFLISSLLCSTPCIASTIGVNEIQCIIDEIEETSEDVVGAAVAIIQNDQVLYKKTFGYKEINGSPVNDDTLFGLASVSKAITATALAALAEQNIAHFEDKINIQGINLSLKKILSHTTGYRIRGDSEIEKGVTRKTLLSLINKNNRSQSKTENPYFYRKLKLKSRSKSTLIFHSGYINGATAFVGIVPELHVGIVLLANQSSRFPLKTGLKIWKEMIEKYKL